MKAKVVLMCVSLIILDCLGVVSSLAEAAGCKVLVVHSFSEPFYWSKELQTGIEKALNSRCDLKNVYLDVETAPTEIEAKGQQAYRVYQEWQPDAVIACDEVSQAYFVAPYLKEKVATPVIFASLFAPEQQFGYPTANVTGVRQTARWVESFNFLQQLVPTIKTVVAVVNDAPNTRGGAPLFEKLLKDQGATVLPTFFSNNPEELLAKFAELEPQVDAFLLVPSVGEEITRKMVSMTNKPTYSGWRQSVEWGVLCAVTESGEEIGRLAGEMLVKVLDGTPIAQLPITQNEFGRRMINVNTLKALKLEPSRRLLTGVELIKTK